MISLSNRNQELEESLREAQQSCQRYQIKSNVQNILIKELVDAIHSMAQRPSNDKNNDENSNSNNININEDACLLLTKNARRIADLSMEIEKMKLQQQEQEQLFPTSPNKYSDGDDHNRSNDDDDVRFEDIPLDGNVNRSMTSSSSSSSSLLMLAELEEENIHIKSKCDSLERSVHTLKHKNTEREVRSMMSLRNMRGQIDDLNEERKRRLNMQVSVEECAFRLQEEINQIKKNRCEQKIFLLREKQQQRRRQNGMASNDNTSELLLFEDPARQKGEEEIIFSLSNICDDSGSRSSSNNNKRSENNSTSRSLNRSREMVMARNELSRSNSNHDSFPPLLMAVSEDDSEDDDDHSDASSGVSM